MGMQGTGVLLTSAAALVAALKLGTPQIKLSDANLIINVVKTSHGLAFFRVGISGHGLTFFRAGIPGQRLTFFRVGVSGHGLTFFLGRGSRSRTNVFSGSEIPVTD